MTTFAYILRVLETAPAPAAGGIQDKDRDPMPAWPPAGRTKPQGCGAAPGSERKHRGPRAKGKHSPFDTPRRFCVRGMRRNQ